MVSALDGGEQKQVLRKYDDDLSIEVMKVY